MNCFLCSLGGRFDFNGCNGFIFDKTTGRCTLGYMEPNWFLSNEEGDQAIYTDVITASWQQEFIVPHVP